MRLFIKQFFSRDLVWAIVLSLLAVFVHVSGLFSRWENQFYDLTIRTFFDKPFNRNIAIVAIDDKSLNELGRWPWPRSVHAEFIGKLSEKNPKAVGYDVMFALPDRANPDLDRQLLAAVKRNSNLVFPVFPERTSVNNRLRVVKPWPELAEISRLGHVDIEIDTDGIVRSCYLFAGMNRENWPAFALALYDPEAENKASHFIRSSEPSLNHWFRVSHIYFPFVSSPPMFSFVDVMNNEKIREQLRGKYVIVGVTAAGMAQGFNTPLSNQQFMSGAELHANIVNALIQQSTIACLNPFYIGSLTFLLVFLPLFFSRCIIRVDPLWPLTMQAGFTVFLSILLLARWHVRYDPIAVLLALFLSYLLYNRRSQHFISQLLFQEKAKAIATLNSIGDAVITTDDTGIVDYLNPAAETLTGCTLKEARGCRFASLLTIQHVNGDTHDEIARITENLKKGFETKTSSPCLVADNLGKEHVIRIRANAIKDSLQRISGMVFALSDISETFELNQKMAYLATHDPLTGLPNRSLLEDRLKQIISYANRKSNFFAVLFVDLDGFKKINDGLGHAVGDQVLKEISSRLCKEIRENDSVARWGGDEFIILLTDLMSEEVVTRITEKIVANLQPPIYIDEHKLFVTPSIGISIYPKDGFKPEILITRADAAMFKAKEKGRNNFCFFSKELNQKAKDRLILEKEMHHALEQGEFEVFYQPQINLKTCRIVGVEALLRWNHNSKGFIMPDVFIPIAEEVGLINPIGEWVLDSVCRQMTVWQQSGFVKIKTAVNLSPRQFLQADLCHEIKKIIVKHALNPKFVDLEITESLMIKDVDRICEILHNIKALGVSIAVDDFGTGYSSLSFLKRFPIDQLKIDKSFISQLTTNSDDANIAKALISLAHNMDMLVVAEGIENWEQLKFLNEKHCDIGQGYLFSRPLSAKDMTVLLDKSGGILKL